MLDKEEIRHRLRAHLTMLTRTIGERSPGPSSGLARAAAYVEACFEKIGLAVERQTYYYHDEPVDNVIARMKSPGPAAAHYVLGAHYDSVPGTVGADDNASAVAVMLETARVLLQPDGANAGRGIDITFAAFTLEESPAYGTPNMGSRVFASRARQENMAIDGMICLEMVGYTCHEPGCQRYPFPLQFLGYPKTGDFIGIVGNVNSLALTHAMEASFLNNPRLPVAAVTVPLNGWLMPNVRLSDHASFWNKGYPAVMVTDSAFYRNPHYHQPSDTMLTLDFDFMTELVVSLMGFFRG